jgi:pilus assembly protein CpaD
MFFGPQTTKIIVIMSAVLTLGGCVASDKYTLREPHQATASQVQYRHNVRFDNTGFASNEMRRLESFLAQINLRRSDSIFLVAGSGRRSVNRKSLKIRGVDVRAQRSDFGLSVPVHDAVNIVVRRYVVTLPGCPDWSGKLTSYTNTPSSNWGCATAINLGLMIAEPSDLVRGRDLGVADGEALAGAIERYRKGETKAIVPEDISSVAGGG